MCVIRHAYGSPMECGGLLEGLPPELQPHCSRATELVRVLPSWVVLPSER